MTTFKFTEEYIQDKLNGFFAISTQKYVLENLYIFNWESDKFIETRSGLIYEFEIKVTRSDFKNDFKKEDKHVILEGKKEYIPAYDKVLDRWKSLHEEYYRTSRYKKPNYFYYAVPEGMISVDEVPEYAGLVYVLPEGERKNKDGQWCDGFYVVKNAPKLHSTKYTDDELNLSEKFYYNMISWKDKCRDEKNRRLLTEDEEHKIPYAELLEKYEKAEKERKALATLVNLEANKAKLFAETMETDRKIIHGYQLKMKELDPNFDIIKFEDQFFDDDE
jgi:hypothetical protein